MRKKLYVWFWQQWLKDRHVLGHPVEAFLYRAAMLLRPANRPAFFSNLKGR